MALGAAVPVAATLAHAAATGSLERLLNTTIVQALEMRQVETFATTEDYRALAGTVAGLLGWALVLIAAGVALGRGTSGWLSAPLVTWALSTAGVASVQAPNTYQAFALVFPVGMLATTQLDRLLDRVAAGDHSRRVAVVSTIAAASVAALPLAREAVHLAGQVATSVRADASGPENVARAINSEYADVAAGVEALPVSVTRGDEPVFVFGSPLWYWLLERRQAVEINGWSPQFLTPDLWEELGRELERSRPRAVFVDAFSLPYVRAEAPAILDLLQEEYVPVWTSPRGARYDAGAGTWRLTDRPGHPTPTGGGVRLD